jgi:(2Fe-2S) ferredoxin
LKALIKEEIRQRGWKGVVRVSAAGCLGVCEAGPNIMLYPQEIWFSSVQPADLPVILETVEKLLANET